MAEAVIIGSCHCGNVTYEAHTNGRFLVDCNCSICRRLGTLWLHAPPATANVKHAKGATLAYVRSDDDSDAGIEFHSCVTCGCTTHWQGVSGDRMAVNMRLADPKIVNALPVRRWDGADTWDWID